MRIATAALITLAVSPAAAETATSAGTACEVRFVRAPDDVRHVIESWLAAEPHCLSSIDLRVLPIAEGYYLIAQRPDGRIHERVVPDAQAAGVLVASWVADDWTVEPPPPPVVAPRPMIVDPFVGPENQLGASARPDRIGTHWLSLTGMIRAGGAGGGGIRSELDIFRRGTWSLSVAVALSTAKDQVYFSDGTLALVGTEDIKGVLYLHRTSTFGRWELRGGVGLGAMKTSSGLTWIEERDPGRPWPIDLGAFNGVDEIVPVGEVAVSLARRFAANWSVTGGAVLSMTNQDDLTKDSGMTIVERGAELMFTGGLRYAL